MERFLTVLFLFLVACDPFGFLQDRLDLSPDSSTARLLQMLVWALFYGLAALAVLMRAGQVAWLWSRNRALLFLLLLVLISPLWSAAPAIGLPFIAVYLGIAVTASYLAVRYSPSEFLQLACISVGLAALASLVVVAVFPDYGIMTDLHEGRWRGITGQKNVLGRFMMMGFFFAVLAFLRRPRSGRVLYAGTAVLAAFLLLMSQSVTAWLVFAVILILWPLTRLWLPRGGSGLRSYAVFASGIVVAAAVAMVMPMVLNEVFALSGRDTDLTGRLLIWQGALHAIADRPLLGYGYGVFWDTRLGLSYHYIGGFLDWDAPNAHNGLLELAINVGLVGVACFLAAFLQVAGRTFRLMRVTLDPPADLFVLVLLMTICLNVSEVTIVGANNLLWVSFLYVALRSAYAQTITTAREQTAQAAPRPVSTTPKVR